jgi:hypothetical protein
MQQEVQQPERLLPIARNRYSPHQQLKRPSATVLPLATDLMITRSVTTAGHAPGTP